MIVGEEAIAAFLHVATIGRYQEVLDETLDALRLNALDASLDVISINVVGEGELVLRGAEPRIVVHRRSADVTCFEHPTLAAIRDYAEQNPGARVLYLNCLGGRYRGRAYDNRAEWRRLLHYLLVERAAVCLDALKTFDVCGVDWSLLPLPHMTSNNWWARADYLRRLPRSESCIEAVGRLNPARFGPHWTDPVVQRRHAAEFWLGMGAEVRPIGLFALKETGLPLSEFGTVPWWYLEGIPWEDLAREQVSGADGAAAVLRRQGASAALFRYRLQEARRTASSWFRRMLPR